jgi:hypothetical protein
VTLDCRSCPIKQDVINTLALAGCRADLCGGKPFKRLSCMS